MTERHCRTCDQTIKSVTVNTRELPPSSGWREVAPDAMTVSPCGHTFRYV